MDTVLDAPMSTHRITENNFIWVDAAGTSAAHDWFYR